MRIEVLEGGVEILQLVDISLSLSVALSISGGWVVLETLHEGLDSGLVIGGTARVDSTVGGGHEEGCECNGLHFSKIINYN